MISVIIPHMPTIPGVDSHLDALCRSLPDADEVIIVINDGWGYSRAVNQGLKTAHGDFLVVANNDTFVTHGTLSELCHPNAVMTPRVVPAAKDTKPRCFFCLPRWVYEKVGEFDEQFEIGYWEDDDYIARLEQHGVPMLHNPNVVVSHWNGGGLTMKHMGEQKFYDLNQKRYETKWGPFDTH